MDPNQERCLEAKRLFGWAAWGLFALMVVYPLSFGPAILLCRKAPSTARVVQVFYNPLVTAQHNSRPLAQFIDWYMRPFDR